MRRFGERAALPATARRCSRPAQPGPGMFVLLKGQVAISQRDGLGRRQPLVEQGPGQFLAEVGQLSGRPALVDGHAEGDGRGDPDPARGAAGAARRRGRARRADHPGADPAAGRADPGRPRRAADHRRARRRRRAAARDLPQPQRPSAHRSPSPRRSGGRAACWRTAPPCQGALPLVITPSGSVLHNPTIGDLGRALGLVGRAPGRELFDVAVVGAGPAGLSAAVYAASEGLSVAVLDASRLRRAGRGERADRELPRLPDRHHRQGADRPRLRAGREVRRRDHLPGLR